MPSQPLDYSGRRHARLTRSMTRLAPALLKVLVALRYQIPDGQTRPISNAVLARATGQSEGFVSAAVRWLAGAAVPDYPATRVAPPQPFIRRESLGAGKGYTTTMLPPPELRPRVAPTPAPRVVQMEFDLSPAPDVVGDHGDDPLPEVACRASGRAETPQIGDHGDDPPNHVSHRTWQQQPDDSPAVEAGDQAPPLPPYPNCFEPLAAQLAARFPHYPESAIRTGIAKLRGRRDVQAGRTNLEATLYYCLRSNLPIYSQAELDARSLAHQEHGHALRPRPAAARPAGGVGAAARRSGAAAPPDPGAGRAGASPPERAPIRKFTRSW